MRIKNKIPKLIKDSFPKRGKHVIEIRKVRNNIGSVKKQLQELEDKLEELQNNKCVHPSTYLEINSNCETEFDGYGSDEYVGTSYSIHCKLCDKHMYQVVETDYNDDISEIKLKQIEDTINSYIKEEEE